MHSATPVLLSPASTPSRARRVKCGRFAHSRARARWEPKEGVASCGRLNSPKLAVQHCSGSGSPIARRQACSLCRGFSLARITIPSHHLRYSKYRVWQYRPNPPMTNTSAIQYRLNPRSGVGERRGERHDDTKLTASPMKWPSTGNRDSGTKQSTSGV